MKRTVRENIISPYSLHDANVIAFEVRDNDVIMRTQSGITKSSPVCAQVSGYVEFKNVQWDFSYAYMLGIDGNEGKFAGEKMLLKDFISGYKTFGFSVVDETYGYNQTKYGGYLLKNGEFCECIIELYHEGDMVFVEEE